jgi:hypothetical protein
MFILLSFSAVMPSEILPDEMPVDRRVSGKET